MSKSTRPHRFALSLTCVLACVELQDDGFRIVMAVAYAVLLLGVIFGAYIASKIDPVDQTIMQQLQATPREVSEVIHASCDCLAPSAV